MEQHEKWRAQAPELKAQIHGLVLQTLVADDQHARRVAAQAVAKLAMIELPHGEWPELIDQLIQGANQPTPGPRKSALETLGYICEELGQLEADVLDAPKVNAILTAVVQGMRPEEPDLQIRLISTRALFNALAFAHSNFERPGERDFIMNTLLTGAACPDVSVKSASVECLAEVAILYYDCLATYMEALYGLTVAALAPGEPEEVALQALEMWCAIADEEQDRANEDEDDGTDASSGPRCRNFVTMAAPHLVPILLAQLTKQEDGQEQDEQAWNLATAGATCLAWFAGCIGDRILPLVMPFVEANVVRTDGEESWRNRDAATFAFGAILDGPDARQLAPLCVQGLPVFLSLLSDPHPLVKDTAAWTIGRIFEFVHGADESVQPVVTPENLLQVLDALATAAMGEPHVAAKACLALNHLVTGLGDATDVLAPVYQNLLMLMVNVAGRPLPHNDTSTLQLSAYETLNEVVRACPLATLPLVASLLPAVLNKLRETLSAQPSSPEGLERQAETQGFLCGTLEAVMRTVNQSPELVEGMRSPASGPPAVDQIMEVLMAVMKCRVATVHEDALHAMTALCELAGERFASYLEAFYPVLEEALRNFQEWHVCMTAVGVLGDIARTVEGRILPLLERIMTTLVEILTNGKVDRRIKPQVLSLFGDLALAAEDHFGPYLERVMTMLTQAANLSFTTAQSSDERLREYNNELRTGIFEGFSGILQGMGPTAAPRIAPLVAQLMAFLESVVQACKEDDEAEDVLKAAFGLVGDVCKLLPADSSAALRSHPHLTRIVSEFYNSNNFEQREMVKWAQENIANLARG